MKKNTVKKIILPLLASVVCLFNSCIGISMDIQMNRDGSGKLTMEYRISNMLDSLGSFSGNESLPTIPVGRQDWERTAERIPGMKLTSYSKRETAQDTIISANLDFSNPNALVSFLTSSYTGGSSGENISINHNGNTGSFDFIIFNQPDAEYDTNLISLFQSVFNDYDLSISFSAPGNSTMTITDGKGNTIPAPASAATVSSGRRVSMTMDVFNIINLPQGLGVKFNW